jgi:vancomycin resistance protein YoaR
MFSPENNNLEILKKTCSQPIVILLAILCIPLLTVLTFDTIYQDNFLPNTKIGPANIGGLTKLEARELLLGLTKPIIQEGIQYSYKDTNILVTSNVVATDDIDTSYPLITFETEKAIDTAFAKGKTDSFFQNLKDRWNSVLQGYSVPLAYYLNEEELKTILQTKFSPLETPFQDAQITFTNNHKLITKPESPGIEFDYNKALSETRTRIKALENKTIIMAVEKVNPIITEQVLYTHQEELENIAQKPSIRLVFAPQEWEIKRNTFIEWLTLELEQSATNPKFNIVFAKEPLAEFLNSIAAEIDKKPINAHLVINENKKVEEFTPSQNGFEVNIEKNIHRINELLLKEEDNSLELIVEETRPEIATQDINDLGIKEIIGVGVSDFTGSPPNRIHNIAIGANSVNGTLIPPQGEFSLIDVLGAINGETGYKKELVIKGDKTIPEYGGGLCQIGTTTFRAALETGLPITERRNHSYRVSYYEPAGTDATIYSPKPDFRFLNDTKNHILIQTRLEGNLLVFEFWGSRDGRRVEKSQPTVYNITPPPPTRFIETTDLPPGQKKCTERAHNGADAKFDYKVTYEDGNIKEKTFYSHYIPWQEVCLIGVNPEEKEQEELDAKEEATQDAELKEETSKPSFN